MKKKITAIVPTFNVENTIERCLNSVKWADEIIVVDSFSTDNTLNIAEKFSAKILQHEYIYSAKQKNWTIPQATHEWVLLLDSDEVVTTELADEIQELLSSAEIVKYNGFAISRREYFLGKWMRWGGRYPLRNIRLFKKWCRYEDRDVHAHIILPREKIKNLKNDILHFSNPNIEHLITKFNRYSTYQANYLFKKRNSGNKINLKKLFTHSIYFKSVIKDYWYFIPLAPFARFIYMYFARLGFLDGRHGFLLAVFYGLQDYISKTKYIELCGKKPKIRLSIQDFLTKIISKKSAPTRKLN